MVGGGGAEQQLLHEPDPPPPGASFELLEERLRLEVLRDIVVEAGDDLVDLLLPAGVDVLAHLHGAEELPQRLLHHPAEARGDLCRTGRGGGRKRQTLSTTAKQQRDYCAQSNCSQILDQVERMGFRPPLSPQNEESCPRNCQMQRGTKRKST